MDPTKVHAINQQDAPQWGVLIRVLIPGSGDGILTLPPSIKTEEQAAQFLVNLQAKCHLTEEAKPGDPNPFTPDEANFLQAILVIGQNVLRECLEWKVVRSFTPAEVKQLADSTAPLRRAEKGWLS